MKTKQFTIHLEEELAETIERLAEEDNRSKNFIIVQLIKKALTK